ncbi:MAG TPA: pyruvate kinase [Vicinamibacterales bacterium]|nr:pyruvate kinase [Vicinamibacterales bacterium]
MTTARCPIHRRTKIVATLGPASSQPGTLDALVAAGVDVFRLNFSHGTHESHAATFHAVRAAARRAGRDVAILQDLSGPKIRTGRLAGGAPVELKDGDEVRLAAGDGEGSRERIFTRYAELIDSARAGDRLLLDDGKIELRVESRGSGELITTVVNGGTLAEKKGINAPGVQLPPCAVTPKDETDLRFGLDLGVDLVALSFVQAAGDVQKARAIVRQAKQDVPIIAKIERPQALEHLDAILTAADGVMVARGDLGLECPLEQIPRIQKAIVARSRTLGRPVILATQVLESMRTEPRPTRAEVSDAATAVDQGVDAIMLSGETASGEFPVRSVQTLAAIIADAETVATPAALLSADVLLEGRDTTGPTDGFDTFKTRHGRAMCEAAVTLASTGQAEAIVAVTRFGKTAQLLSSLRPPAAILAVTPSGEIARRLNLYWGVQAMVSDLQDLRALEGPIRLSGHLGPRAVVVFINITPDLTRQDANFLNVQQLSS